MSKRRDSVGQLISCRFHRRGAPFSKRLTAHTSCVNSLAWSGNGRWLASAGDDRRVLLWDFHPLNDLSAPVVCTGPRANILSLAFTASNNFVLSGGLEQEVFQYDVSRMSASPLAERPVHGDLHNGSIHSITSHAYKDELFITGSDNGEVILHDTRVPLRYCGVGGFSVNAEVTSVQFHPHMEHLFVMSDEKGKCNLLDTRMVFDHQHERHEPRSLVNYVTKISKLGSPHFCNPEISSVVFDSTGTRLAVTMLHFLPTIYTIWDKWPIAICSGAQDVPTTTAPQDPHNKPCLTTSRHSYMNNCTMKNGSFGSAGTQQDCYYGTGSDDFRGYIWHIPDGLASRRQELTFSDWTTEPPGDTIGFAETVTGRRLVPVQLQRPHSLLYGHKSIVNTVRFHPLEPYIATSGIERHIIVHSPFEATPACGVLPRTERSVREIPEYTSLSHNLITGEPHDSSQEAGIDNNDESLIRLFDEILRQEGTPDVFDIRNCHEDDSGTDPDQKSYLISDSTAGDLGNHSSSP